MTPYRSVCEKLSTSQILNGKEGLGGQSQRQKGAKRERTAVTLLQNDFSTPKKVNTISEEAGRTLHRKMHIVKTPHRQAMAHEWVMGLR